MATIAPETPRTKTDRKMEDAMLAFAGDQERVAVLQVARTFKRSWLELAESLTAVYDREAWARWGFDSFEAYTQKELHLRQSTVAKLLGSFRFLKTNAPKVLERVREPEVATKTPDKPIPSLQVVDFVSRAMERGAADSQTMKEIETAAFDEGAEASALSRRFKSVAFPVAAAERTSKLRDSIRRATSRLANLLADPDAPLPTNLAAEVEESLGKLLEALDKD